MNNSANGNQKNKKILYVLSSSISYILIEGLIESLAKEFKVYLITSFDPLLKSKCKKNNIIYYSSPIKRYPSLFWDLISFFHSFLILIKIRPDVVNYSTPKASFIYSLSTFLFGTKNRVYLVRGLRHETLKNSSKILQINVEKICCILSSKIIALSSSVKNNLIREGLCKTKKIDVIGPGGSGIISDRFSKPTVYEKKLSRKLFKVKKGFFVIGFCGRLVPRKGIEDLVEAFQELQSKHKNIFLLLAGSYDAKSVLKASTLRIINENNFINYAGYIKQKDLRSFYHCLDLYVSASFHEGFGNTQVEAAKCGLPVVAKNVTGSKDAVKNNFNGTLVNPNSPKYLEKAIEKYMSNKEIYKKHSENSIFWSKKFSRNKITSDWKIFYRQLLKAKKTN